MTTQVTNDTLAADAVSTDKIVDGAVSAAKLATNAVTTAKLNAGAVTGPKIAMGADARGDILVRGAADYGRLAKGTVGQVLTSDGTDPAWATPIFSEAFTSGDQAITAAGLVTVAHGLTAAPSLVQVRLKCTDVAGEGGWAQNDEVITPHMAFSTASRGVELYADATNVYARVGSDANSFTLLNKTTGAAFNITNSKWALIIKAWV